MYKDETADSHLIWGRNQTVLKSDLFKFKYGICLSTVSTELPLNVNEEEYNSSATTPVLIIKIQNRDEHSSSYCELRNLSQVQSRKDFLKMPKICVTAPEIVMSGDISIRAAMTVATKVS